MTRKASGLFVATLAIVGVVAGGGGHSSARPSGQQAADWILTAQTVLTMDSARHVYSPGMVAIRNGRIVAAGPAELAREFRPARRLDLPRNIVLPGLINAHTHAPMTLFRGLADDLKLHEWLERFIFPAEARFVRPDFVQVGTELALVEMIRSGTTTFADMYYFEDVLAQVVHRAGMRAVLGETVLDLPAPDFSRPQQTFQFLPQFLSRWKNDPLIYPAVAPHAIYTCSAETLRQAAALAERYGVRLLIHLAETEREVNDSRHEHGLTPVAYLDTLGLLSPHLTAAHCVWVTPGDMELLARRGAGCVYNPSSNLKLASGMAPVTRLLAAGVAVGLGTDGAASNNNLDLLREVDFAAKLQKLATGDPTSLPAEQALALATIEGARALHLETEVGSLEPGKQADLTILSLDNSYGVPMYNPYSAVVYALESGQVRYVFVAGRPLLLNGKLLTLDEPLVLERARRYARRLAAELPAAQAH